MLWVRMQVTAKDIFRNKNKVINILYEIHFYHIH